MTTILNLENVIQNIVHAHILRRAPPGVVVRFLLDREPAGWWLRLNGGEGKNIRHSKAYLSIAETTAADPRTQLYELVHSAASYALMQLFPPCIPFRIGRRSHKRLRIVR